VGSAVGSVLLVAAASVDVWVMVALAAANGVLAFRALIGWEWTCVVGEFEGGGRMPWSRWLSL